MKHYVPERRGVASRVTPTPMIAAAIAGVLYGVSCSPVAIAQSAAASPAGNTTLEEIVVTATRRAASVEDIPFNISAVSGKQIEAQNLSNPVDLLRTVPGVSVVDRGVRNAGTLNNVRIRGVNVDSAQLGDYVPAGAAAISSYVNDTPIFANFLLKDVDRVEVLRGPQGTLYGRGSMGGTVRYILRDPVIGETSANVAAGVSFTNGSGGVNWSTDGTVNIPANANLALRANYSHQDNAGVVDYVNLYKLDANGIPVAPNGLLDQATQYTSKKDADWSKIDYGRLAATWAPTAAARVVLSLAHQKDSTGGRSQIVAPGTPNYALGGTYGEYQQGAVMLEPSGREVSLASLEATFDLGFASLTSSTSYTDHTGTSTNDNSGLYAKGFPFLYYFYPRLMAQKYRDYSDRSFAQEFRLVSKTQGPVDYIAGLYYEEEKLHSGETDWVRGFSNWWAAENAVNPGLVYYYDPVAPTSDRDFLYSRNEQFTETAVFGELTWHVTPRAQVTLGGRYFQDKDANQLTVTPDLPTRVPETSPLVPDISKNKSIFKLNGSWRLSARDSLYATRSQGYRRGGVNDIPTTGYIGENPGWLNFGPDTLINYEVGVKGAHESFSYNASVFRIDWKDIQLNTATPVWGYYVTANAGKARSQGLELELRGKFTSSLSYALGYAYTDAKLVANATRPYAPYALIAPSGSRLPAAPESVINASLDYTVHLSSGLSLVPHLDAFYQSGTLSRLATTEAAAIPMDGYTILNASLALDSEKWTVALQVRNLSNAAAISGIFPEGQFGSAPLYPDYFNFFINANGYGFFGDTTRELIARPRTIGLIAKYRF
ncbi:MAG TPA: TonB-dependent receptor [Steroidobacteraceae bacterium]|nr:TonB-dependent receptor [Steroidobacteraceae bacterium]